MSTFTGEDALILLIGGCSVAQEMAYTAFQPLFHDVQLILLRPYLFINNADTKSLLSINTFSENKNKFNRNSNGGRFLRITAFSLVPHHHKRIEKIILKDSKIRINNINSDSPQWDWRLDFWFSIFPKLDLTLVRQQSSKIPGVWGCTVATATTMMMLLSKSYQVFLPWSSFIHIGLPWKMEDLIRGLSVPGKSPNMAMGKYPVIYVLLESTRCKFIWKAGFTYIKVPHT